MVWNDLPARVAEPGTEEARVTTTVENPSPTPVSIGAPRGGPDQPTLRKDNWWVEPLVTFVVLVSFVAYSTWAAFVGKNYYAGADLHRDLISPFYSPCIANSCVTGSHSFGTLPFWNYSPALLILIFPLGFRLTCYYYRKSYYRSFWLSPPACAVADAGSATPGTGGFRKRYTGETRFPLVLQKIHRYFWYFTLFFAALLTYDAIEAFRFPGGIGMGLGTVILVINAVFIWAYQLGCHACRHLTGGNLRKFST
ncbi:MAG: hypothetical protein ACLQU9_15615, partial [Acidimicrobiales bacterium]